MPIDGIEDRGREAPGEGEAERERERGGGGGGGKRDKPIFQRA